MNVVGFDLSYSRTGFCHLSVDPDTGLMQVSTDKFKTLPNTPLITRTKEIKDWVVAQIACLTVPGKPAHYITPDIIVVENAVFGGKRASMLGSLSMGVLLGIYETFVSKGVDLLLVPPPTLKRSACVTGKAKSLMVAAFKLCNPDYKRICNDEADAYFLALLGVAYKTAERGGTISKVAHDVLFNEELTKPSKSGKPGKPGKPRGIALRAGEYFYEGCTDGV